MFGEQEDGREGILGIFLIDFLLEYMQMSKNMPLYIYGCVHECIFLSFGSKYLFYYKVQKLIEEREKRITEHDTAASQGFDRPEITLAVCLLPSTELLGLC